MRYLLAILVLAAAAAAPHALAESECEIARQAMQQASIIRGLKIKKPVPCLVHSRDQVRKFIETTIAEKIPPEKLRMEEVTYKALGLIPEQFNYARGMAELYLSQIGGYYDPDKKHFVMAGWMPAMMQPTIASHELTHALQDQYYNLQTFIDPKSDNSDEQLAHAALVEGDATAVMMDYVRRLMGQPGLAHDRDVTGFMMQNVIGMSLTAGMSGVPQSLQLVLLFPYTSGMRFVHHCLRKGGYAEVDKVYKRAPRSTEEILHPEKYGSGKAEFITFSDADFSADLSSGESIKYRDTLGEFVISTLLGTYINDKIKVTEASAGWGGDRVVIIREGNARSYRLLWKSNWDSERDAEEFYTLLVAALTARFAGKDFSHLDRGVDAGAGRSFKGQREVTRVTLQVRWPA